MFLLPVYFLFALDFPPIFGNPNDDGGAFEKFKIDTAILHKMHDNESLLAPTPGMANDLARKVSRTTRDRFASSEEFFNPEKRGAGAQLMEAEGVMAMLGVTLKDAVYRRRWQDLVMLGHDAVMEAFANTTDPSFYIKDLEGRMHTVDGEQAWRKVRLFVKSWSGIGDYYRFVEMIDAIPDGAFFADVETAKEYFHNGLTTTTEPSKLVLPSTRRLIMPYR
uniref:Uncharacterized protein n=1 Tax=Cacopsylla melanoneura TaxID=428564 RepID=A0A8D8V8J0_9HEMI